MLSVIAGVEMDVDAFEQEIQALFKEHKAVSLSPKISYIYTACNIV